MNEQQKKQYGLILKKKEAAPTTLKKANVFGDLDENDEVEKVDTSYSKSSASTIRFMKHAERQHEAALAADSTIFDYDASYDEIQAVKNAKIAEQKEKDKERKSKYAEEIIKAHKRREIEKQSREERQQQKERVKEGDEFADKEVFVTGAYREQMEMVQKFREEEAYEQRFNDLTSVEKQKVWQAGMSRQLLEDLSRDGGETSKRSEKKEVPKKERHIRKRLDNDSDSDAEKKEQEKPKKSIYSDDEEGPAFAPPKKNFEGELKPGLNKVARRPSPRSGRAETKHDRIKSKMFTPSPEPSDDEGRRRNDRRRDRREESPYERRDDRKDDKRDDRKSGRKEEEQDRKKEKPVVEKKKSPEEIKAERLRGLKEILKQRNGPEEIEEYRKRFLERRENNFVPPPI